MPWPKKPALERFQAKFIPDRETGCWNWTAATDKDGYGVFAHGTRPNGHVASTRAHRWSHEHFIGPIPEGMQIDHLCRNHGCVNPAHLEAVTNLENQLRGVGTFVVTHGQKTHCPKGHEYTDENVYLTGTGGRACRECHRVKQRELQRRKRTAARAAEASRAA